VTGCATSPRHTKQPSVRSTPFLVTVSSVMCEVVCITISKAGTVRINIVSAITEVALLMISSSRSSRHKQSWLAVVTNVPCRYGDLKAGISSKQSDCLEGLLANQEFWRMRGSGAHWMQQYPLSLFRTVYPGRGTRMCLPGSVTMS
jgi:hypothetical protein